MEKTPTFQLHPQLANDCIILGQLELCLTLLMDNAHFPWLILVPMKHDITEIYQLDPKDRETLMSESSVVAQTLMEHFDGDKMNLGALGNLVPQFHLHHIVRYHNDPAWPDPVWGNASSKVYSTQETDKISQQLQHLLGLREYDIG
ncbi:MAG: HIT domain-containing protein [Arenicella sp.]